MYTHLYSSSVAPILRSRQCSQGPRKLTNGPLDASYDPDMHRIIGIVSTIAFLMVSSGSASTVPPTHPLATGFMDTVAFRGEDGDVAFEHAKDAGASTVRIPLIWRNVAPVVRPSGFVAGNPDDPSYDWTTFDRQVKLARSHGLEPMLDIVQAPGWAEGVRDDAAYPGNSYVDHRQLGVFARAAALHYGGSSGGVPRVRVWQVWNEPNLSVYLAPTVTAPIRYRAMVNATADAIHSVHADNLVVAGLQSPFGHKKGEVKGLEGMAPMEFMRKMLCMSTGTSPRSACSARSTFDVWAHHPYTSGGPTHSAYRPDDASLGDLPEMKQLLDAAVKAGHVRSNRTVQFWVTEFSWDSAPPDPKGVPLALHARWVSEALYRSWQAGVSLFSWLLLRDEPFGGNAYCQCGLYLRGDTVAQDKPKPALQAFRFPFVAFSQPNKTVSFWGRTPGSDAKPLVVEQGSGSDWKTVATVRSNRYGIFQGTYPSAAKTGYVRARIVGGDTGDTARPFGLRVPPDRDICAFGTC